MPRKPKKPCKHPGCPKLVEGMYCEEHALLHGQERGDGTISETGTAVSTILPYVKKWPHIKWLLTIMNHGTASIFTALRENTNGAQDTFISEIVRIIDKYPWCSGIDIDLERGGELANRAKANALFSRIYSTVKAKGVNLHQEQHRQCRN